LDAWVEGNKAPVLACEVPEGQVPKGDLATIHDYGIAVAMLDLCKLGPDCPLRDLFQQGRQDAENAKIYPSFRTLVYDGRPRDLRIDLYNEPLSAHTAAAVLDALKASQELRRSRMDAPFRRLATFRALLEEMHSSGSYGDVTVLSYGH
jgi:hypothetical protein